MTAGLHQVKFGAPDLLSCSVTSFLPTKKQVETMCLGHTNDDAHVPSSKHSQLVGAVVSKTQVSPRYAPPPLSSDASPTPPDTTKYCPITAAACPSRGRGTGPAVFTCSNRSAHQWSHVMCVLCVMLQCDQLGVSVKAWASEL